MAETPNKYDKKRKIAVKLAPPLEAAAEDGDHEDTDKPVILPPLLTSFPHGLPRDVDSLDLQCRVSDSRGGLKRRRVRLTAQTQYVKYECDQTMVNRKSQAKFMVGVFNKTKGELVLYPSDTVFTLEQRVKVQELEDGEDEQDKQESQTYAERRKSLVQAFGTKKKRNVMKSREENRISAEGVVGLSALGSLLGDTAKAAAQDAADANPVVSATEASRAALLPPFKRDGETPHGVYSARSFMLPEAWESLEDVVDDVMAHVEDPDDSVAFRDALLSAHEKWPEYVKSLVILALVPEARQKEGERRKVTPKRDHAVCLLFLKHLIELYGSVESGVSSPEVLTRRLYCPEAVAVSLLERFFSREGERSYKQGKAQRDKLLLHILVMCLITSNFRAPVARIAQDLRMSQGDCCTLFKETGAGIKRGFGGKGKGKKAADDSVVEMVAELQLPLKFPMARLKASSIGRRS